MAFHPFPPIYFLLPLFPPFFCFCPHASFPPLPPSIFLVYCPASKWRSLSRLVIFRLFYARISYSPFFPNFFPISYLSFPHRVRFSEPQDAWGECLPYKFCGGPEQRVSGRRVRVSLVNSLRVRVLLINCGFGFGDVSTALRRARNTAAHL